MSQFVSIARVYRLLMYHSSLLKTNLFDDGGAVCLAETTSMFPDRTWIVVVLIDNMVFSALL